MSEPLPPVYSPTDVADWKRCPAYRQLRRSGLRVRGDSGWEAEIPMLMGRAIGDGLSAAYLAWGLSSSTEEIAQAVTKATLEQGYVENPEWPLPALLKLGQKGLSAAIGANLPSGKEIVLVDKPLGVARPDLILRLPDQTLEIIDTKVAMNLDQRYEYQRLEEAETDDQWWHYAWEAQEVLQQVVSRLTLHLVALAPRVRSVPHSWEVTPERVARWYADAQVVWQDMEAERQGTRPIVWRWENCIYAKYGRKGRCPYYDFHHVFNGDEEKATVLYTRTGV